MLAGTNGCPAGPGQPRSPLREKRSGLRDFPDTVSPFFTCAEVLLLVANGDERVLDARHFDALAKALTVTNSRRWLLALLAALPVGGGLSGILSPEESAARGRRKRRVKRHKHGSGRRRNSKKRKKRKCIPVSVAQTCEGKCGRVTDNCGQPVDCGACLECTTSADCEMGLVCDASSHVCRSCLDRFECAPIDQVGNRYCQPLFDRSGQSRCVNMQECGCPGTCADCAADQVCMQQGGDACAGKNLCCPSSPAL